MVAMDRQKVLFIHSFYAPSVFLIASDITFVTLESKSDSMAASAVLFGAHPFL